MRKGRAATLPAPAHAAEARPNPAPGHARRHPRARHQDERATAIARHRLALRSTQQAHPRTAPATPLDRRGGASCHTPTAPHSRLHAGAQPCRPLLDYRTQRRKCCLQHCRALSRQSIWPSTTVRGDWLNQPPLLQTADRAVQRARPKPHTSKALDIQKQRMTMLRTRRKARQNQNRRIILPPAPTSHTPHPDRHSHDHTTPHVVNRGIGPYGDRTTPRESARSDAPTFRNVTRAGRTDSEERPNRVSVAGP